MRKFRFFLAVVAASAATPALAYSNALLLKCVPALGSAAATQYKYSVADYGTFYESGSRRIYFIGHGGTYDVNRACFERVKDKPTLYPAPSDLQ